MSDGVRVALFFAALFSAAAISTAFLPLWFADRGLSAVAIGQVLGAAALLRVFAGPGWGTLADRIGRRPVMLAASVAATVAALCYVPSRGFLLLLVVAGVQGVAASALNPLIDSLALSLARDGRMDYGKVRSIGSVAYMAASAGPGWLLSVAGTWLVPWLLAASYGAGAAVTPLLPETADRTGVRRSLAGLHLFAIRPFRLTVLASALIQGAHAAYYGFAPLFWRAHGLSDGMIGMLIAEGIVAEVALFAWGRRLIERLGPAGLTACAATASIVRWSAMAFAPPLAVLAAVQLLHAATFAMQHLSAMLVLSRSVPPERAATAQALHAALGYGAPGGLLMLLAGFLYSRFGGLAFLAMAAIGGSALLLVRPLRR
ncbi:MAG TPA: MFS transporter [Acetobacteraceae bacterium]|jgi:MFS transporter, PPP family, 3-phenylpropionic acid transporter|nr:MFS transporter [Acetobacteraceae bacterium]